MRFKPGDIVIKSTGGNKMKIVECREDGSIDCVWATDDLNRGEFREDDLVSINDYKSSIMTEKRDDLIDRILDKDKLN